MTLPTLANTELMAGDYHSLVVQLRDSAGEPVDITGYTVTWSLATSATAVAAVTKSTATSGITVTDASLGQLTIELLSSDTAPLSGAYYHECQLLQSDGKAFTMFRGKFIITPQLVPGGL